MLYDNPKAVHVMLSIILPKGVDKTSMMEAIRSSYTDVPTTITQVT